MKAIRVVHVPYTRRNPYQQLLFEGLSELGLDVNVAKVKRLLNRSFFDITILLIILKYWKPDIIHLHWQHVFLIDKRSWLKSIAKSFIFFVEIILAKLIGVKIVWTVHNIKKHENAHQNLEKYITRILARLTDVIIAHCKTAKMQIHDALKVKNNKKITVIPHGNYLDCYKNSIKQEEAINLLNLSEAEMRFIFLGEIRYYKGVFELIDAFLEINSGRTELIIAGKPKTNKIKHEVENRVKDKRNIYTILEFIPDDELEIYINASDIMVFPYRDIFTSGGIQLAMSFGKPIIAPLKGCIIDTIDEYGAFLYDAVDKKGLKTAMRQSMHSKDKLEIMGNYNLEVAKRNNWLKIAEMTKRSYLADSKI